MLRFVATGDGQAFDDLVWSVGGSPPWGDVGWDEASAVFDLLEAYRGPGRAPSEAYERVAGHLGGRADAVIALETFRIHDRIASDPDSVAAADVAAGAALADDLQHPGLRCYFALLQADLARNDGDIAGAKATTAAVVLQLAALAAEDSAYLQRARTAAQNTAALAAMDADTTLGDVARQLLQAMGVADAGPMVAPSPTDDFERLSAEGSDLLESGDPTTALDRFARALDAAGDDERHEAALCGMLGDMAVAYNRVGNLEAAIGTYHRAIDLSRRRDDAVNLSRWTSNLVGLLLYHDRADEAAPFVTEMLESAAQAGQPELLGSAIAHLGPYLLSQGRHAEALEQLEGAARSAEGHPILEDIIRRNRSGIGIDWGERLRDEGRASEAIDVLQRAVALADTDDGSERHNAIRAHLMLADLFERRGDPNASARHFATARELAGDDAADWPTEPEDALGSLGRAFASPDALDPEAFAERASAAAAEAEPDRELSALANRASALLATDSDAALAEFDALQPRLRALSDRRRELVLILNFLPELLDRGQNGRAVELAERALELSGTARRDYRIVALLRHGAVMATALHDPARALASYKEGFGTVRSWTDAPAGLLDGIRLDLLEAAQLALEAGDTPFAAEIAEFVGMDVGAPPSVPAPADRPSAEELRAVTIPALDEQLAAWAAGPVPADRMETPFLTWMEAASARLAQTGRPHAIPAAGAGGLVRLGTLVADDELPFEDAVALAAELDVAPDAAAVTALFALQEVQGRPGGIVLRLIAATTPDDALAAWVYRALMVFTSQAGDDRGARELCAAGLARLAGGADDALRAELLNERALQLMERAQHQDGHDAAVEAARLAEAHGYDRLARMAKGNAGMALMHLGRSGEALAVFEALAPEQERAGEVDELQATMFNLRAARRLSGDSSAVFDPESSDPDEVFAHAQVLSEEGDASAAIVLFERGFDMVESGTPAATERAARRAHAQALAAAGRLEEALERFAGEARRLEQRDDHAQAAEIYYAMAALTLDEPLRARTYVEAGIRAAETAGDSEPLARAAELRAALEELAHEGQPDVKRQEALWEQARTPAAARALAEAYVQAGAPGRAVQFLERVRPELDASAPGAGALGLDTALGIALDVQGESERALRVLHAARDAGLAPDAGLAGIDAALAYATALLRAGRAHEAVDVIEECAARKLPVGGETAEQTIRLRLGQALAQMGDAVGAERVLARMTDRARARGATSELGQALAARGQLAVGRGDFDAAREHLSIAADVAAGLGDDPLRALVLDALGTVYARLGRPGRSVEYHRDAGALLHGRGAPGDELIVRIHLTQRLLELRDRDSGEVAFREALELVDAADGPAAWWLQFQAALLTALQGDWDEAAPRLRRSLEAVHRAEVPDASPAMLWRRIRTGEEAYAIAAAYALRAGDARFAVEILEARRAGFMQAVVQRRARRPAGVDEAAWVRHERAADALALLRAERRAGGADADPDFDERLSAAERAYAAAYTGAFRATAPDEAAPVELPRFDALTARIPKGAAIAYVGLGERIELACAGRGVDGEAWAEAALVPGLTAAELDDADGAGLDRVCALLHDRLWPPLRERLPAGTERLLLLPAGELAGRPLAAAALGRGRRDELPSRLGIAPSLEMVPRDAEPPPGELRLGQAVDPGGDLRFSRYEADAVRAVHPGPVITRAGADATAAAVLELLGSCDVVHFAGHGTFDPDDPLQSHLRCAPTETDDGHLSVMRILSELPTMRARLVVLSACASGALAARQRGDELVGLPGTFLVSGAAAVIATDREVDDLQSSLLIGEFFRRWQGGALPAATALRDAQRWLRSELTADDVARAVSAWAAANADDAELQEAATQWRRRADGAPAFPKAEHWAPFHLVGMP